MNMKTVYNIGLIGVLLVVLSGCAGIGTDKVVQLMPSTGAVVADRVDYYRARTSSADESGDEQTFSTQLLVFPAVVIDVREQIANNPDHAISANDLMAWEDQHGRIPRGSIVLLQTGWKEDWERPDPYAGGEFRLPACDGSVTPFLLNERGVDGLGIDRKYEFDKLDEADLDPNEADMAQTLLEQWVSTEEGIILENLENFDQLPPTGVNLQIGILYRDDINTRSVVSVKAFIPKE